MKHFLSFEEVELANTWATIGTFDGVHRGHQAILGPLAQEARAAGATPAVVTFYPHPMAVLRGSNGPLYLTSPQERARKMGALGIEAVVTLTFDRALADLSAEEFMRRMASSMGLQQLWVGSDFALGRNRQGDLPTLRALGQQLGYELRVIEHVQQGGDRISSSAIRRLVREGDVARAAQMLGQPYSLEGTVIHGDGRGQQLGFPTANVAYWTEKIVPTYGVYATWTVVDGKRMPSVTSIGVRPTFDPPGAPPRLEAYLLDFDGDLYDQTVRVEFLQFLRPELRFSTPEALIDQMVLDTQRAREVLANAA